MSAFWWYLAGVATLPALFFLWACFGIGSALLFGRGTFTVTTTVNGRITERRTVRR